MIASLVVYRGGLAVVFSKENDFEHGEHGDDFFASLKLNIFECIIPYLGEMREMTGMLITVSVM